MFRIRQLCDETLGNLVCICDLCPVRKMRYTNSTRRLFRPRILCCGASQLKDEEGSTFS